MPSAESIVSVSYPRREFSGGERTETYSYQGSPDDIAVALASTIKSWLEHTGSGTMTIHATGPWSIMDAASVAERVRDEG